MVYYTIVIFFTKLPGDRMAAEADKDQPEEVAAVDAGPPVDDDDPLGICTFWQHCVAVGLPLCY